MNKFLIIRYGWCVTLGAFICLFWTAGLVKSYGVIFAEMMKIYPEEIRSVPVYRLREAAKKHYSLYP